MEWIKVEDRLPEKPDKKEYQSVLCGYFSDNGIFSQYIGFYAYPHKVEFGDEDFDGDFDELEEKAGTLFLKEGWYENIEQVCGQYDYFYLGRICTHWMPLPEPPKQ